MPSDIKLKSVESMMNDPQDETAEMIRINTEYVNNIMNLKMKEQIANQNINSKEFNNNNI